MAALCWVAILFAVSVEPTVAATDNWQLQTSRNVDSIVGTWTTWIASLPDLRLPHVPLLGNGRLGVAMDSRSSSAKPPSGNRTVGPSQPGSVDWYLNTNSYWSCTDVCGAADPDHVVPACCSRAALGGASLRLLADSTTAGSANATAFGAQQIIANGTLTASVAVRSGAGGPVGVLTAVTRMHPVNNIVTINLTWAASAPADASGPIQFSLALWMLGDGTVPGSNNDAVPAPASVGCTSPDGSTVQPCGLSPGQLVWLTRNASTVQSTVQPMAASLAGGLTLGPGASVSNNGPAIVANASVYPPKNPWEVSYTVTLQPGGYITLVVAEAESSGQYVHDPWAIATSMVGSTLQNGPQAVASAADGWWANFWSASDVTLPTQPAVQTYWYGAQYILACASATTGGSVAPGLYGPWVTVDGPDWHGDYTLDYNQQAPYFGAFSSNHGALAEGYWAAITDWIPPAQRKAQVQAGMAHVTCPATALYYACHLAPWGLQSLDGMQRYMTWNGPFAALLFINHWEYTRNASFAQSAGLPLLSGLNDWWLCYLNKTVTGPGPNDYIYSDSNWFNPDYEHEGQPVPNPQIALGFLYRTVTAQVDIMEDLGLQPSAALLDLASHLPPFNTAALNYSASVNFTILNNTRCHEDYWTSYNVPDVDSCQAICESKQPGCAAFSYCPPEGMDGCTGSNGEPKPQTCWGFSADVVAQCVTNATANAGWVSGIRAPGPAANNTATIWTAYSNATLGQSDWFAMYPVWPTEASNPLSPGQASAALASVLQSTGQASSHVYSDFTNGRPVDLFSMTVRAGWNASFPLSWSPTEVLAGLNSYLTSYFGPNLLPYAPGGGMENTGITQAVNDMLVQSYRYNPASARQDDAQSAQRVTGAAGPVPTYVVSLFPFWTAGEPASFNNLLTKGGVLVSASYNATSQAVDSPVSLTVAYTLGGANSAVVGLLNPWPHAATDQVTAVCGGTPAAIQWISDSSTTVPIAAFTAGAGEQCTVEWQE